MNETFVYEHGGSIYINLTNRCTNNCVFCIRNTEDGVDGYDLWLTHEPSSDEVIKQLEEHNIADYREIVFCGYGEPTIRLDVLLAVAGFIKNNYPSVKTRINTNGQANLYHKKDITPKFKGLIDKLSVSLNAPNAKKYQKICISDYGEDAFCGLLEFSKHASRHTESVRLTVVDVIGDEEIAECRKIAEENGLELYIRPSL